MTGWIGGMIASAVVNGMCQGAILVAFVWLALRTIPRVAAATRYAIWMLTLALVTALPLVESLLPGAAGQGGERAASLGDGGAAAITLPVAAPWLLWVLAGWAAISLMLVVRVAWGYKLLQDLKRRAVPLPREYQERFDALQRACPGRRQARLLASDEIASPLAAGLFRPAVLVPGFLVDRLSDTELGDVLTHELAHLRRWDDGTNLVQRLVEALAFFHPAVLWIGRRLSLEREMACDDWVVARTGTPRPYAACLAKLAALIPAASPQLAPGLASPKRQVSIRVEALLRKTRNGKTRASKAALALASTALVLGGTAALPLAPVRIVNPGDTPARAGRASVLRSHARRVPEFFNRERGRLRAKIGAGGCREKLRKGSETLPVGFLHSRTGGEPRACPRNFGGSPDACVGAGRGCGCHLAGAGCSLLCGFGERRSGRLDTGRLVPHGAGRGPEPGLKSPHW